MYKCSGFLNGVCLLAEAYIVAFAQTWSDSNVKIWKVAYKGDLLLDA